MPMNFDEYWSSLVQRVFHEHAQLKGDEERFYRLTCLSGETTVDGIESYFERRFEECEADLAALHEAGFGRLAAEFELARNLLFGSAPLDKPTVETVLTDLLEESDESAPMRAELQDIYLRMIPQLEQLEDYKYSFGLAAGLFQDP